MKDRNYKLRQNNLSKHGCYGDVKVCGHTKLGGQTFFRVKVTKRKNKSGHIWYYTIAVSATEF